MRGPRDPRILFEGQRSKPGLILFDLLPGFDAALRRRHEYAEIHLPWGETAPDVVAGDELTRRWAQEPWISLGPRVHTHLIKGRRIDDLKLPRHNGRLDLRGLPFPRRGRWGTFPWLPELQPPSYDVEVMEGLRSEFKGARIQHVDLSFADLEDTVWENCAFMDVHANHANISHCVFSGCAFEDVDLSAANLNSTVLGGFSGYETNTFRRVEFLKADLRHSGYRFPLFEDCDFSRAKFASVNFEASRFVRCRFAGKMSGTEFHGSWDKWFEIGRERAYFEKRGITPRDIRNPMEQVDFSETDLSGVTFWGVDLSRCKLPQDEKHIIVPDPRSLYDRAKAVLEAEWASGDLDQALDELDLFIGPGDRWLKKLEGVYRKEKSESEVRQMIEQERQRMNRAWHWRATRPTVLPRGLFVSKSRPWGGRLFEVLLRVSRGF